MGVSRARWDEECDKALTSIKQYLSEPPVLASPEASETLFIYLAVSDVAMSASLFKEDEYGKKRPVFFIRKSLADVETRYSHLEKVALALQLSTKKLLPYFQEHPIIVLTDFPLRSTIHKPYLSGRMARWAIELSEFDIQYKPRLANKGQVLADFLAEIPQAGMILNNLDWWILNVDGASRKIKANIGLQLRSPAREKIEQAIRLGYTASNNELKHEALLAGIEMATTVSTHRLLIQSESQLVVGQVNEEYESRDSRMAKYVSLVKQRLGSFSAWKLEHISRDCNKKADTLAAVAVSLPITETVFPPIYYLPDSSINTTRVSQVDEVTPSWMDPIMHYLNIGELPTQRYKAHKIEMQSARFSLVNGQLFKCSLDEPYLR